MGRRRDGEADHVVTIRSESPVVRGLPEQSNRSGHLP
jgi:hypothetical protein